MEPNNLTIIAGNDPELNDEEVPPTENPNTWNRFVKYMTVKHFKPRGIFAALQFGSALLYIISVNVTCLPELPFPLVGNLLPQRFQERSQVSVITLLVMWGLHFLRRFTEVLFIHVFRHKVSAIQIFGFGAHFLVFGLWIGWSVNYKMCNTIFTTYQPPPASLVGMGALFFLLGEVGNCACHVSLRKFRTSSRKSYTTAQGHSLPTGFWFKYVSGPHYFFEIITWIGFAISTCTLSAVLFLGVSTIIIVVSARCQHMEYLSDFNGERGRPDYRKLRRKVIFPGVY